MKKLIRTVDETRKIIQITTADERWYVKSGQDDKPVFVPSVTWICESYPKGIAYFKWLADKGWDEAEALKIAAGDKGSKVHQAITALLLSEEVRMDSKFVNHTTEQEEELTLEEYEALMSFVTWHKVANPNIFENEAVVFNEKYGYAGTIDYLCNINQQLWLIDFKTSQYIWPSHELQLSAYKHALEDSIQKNLKLAILQLGYRKNNAGYKFTEVEDKFTLFLAAKQIWQNEHGEDKPKQKDYPVSLKL